MQWLLLEVGVALFLAIFIVWFTMSGRRKPPPRREDARDGRRASGEPGEPKA